jgi:alcohol dehydrogenase class IV
MKRIILSCLLLVGCSTLNTPQGQAVISTGETLAKVAVTAAATTYGGPLAGQLASSGLDALATVLQSYVGSQVPAAVVKASPGTPAI